MSEQENMRTAISEDMAEIREVQELHARRIERWREKEMEARAEVRALEARIAELEGPLLLMCDCGVVMEPSEHGFYCPNPECVNDLYVRDARQRPEATDA